MRVFGSSFVLAIRGLLTFLFFFVVVFALVTIPLAHWYLSPLARPQHMHYEWGMLLALKSAILFSSLISTWMMSRIENRPILGYLRASTGPSIRRFCSGVGLGAALMAGCIGLIRVCHGYEFGTPEISGWEAVGYAAVWIVVATAYGVGDSIVLFGYPLFTLTRTIGFWGASVLLSLTFVLLHIVWFDANAIGFVAIFCQGLFLCASVRRSGDVATAAGLYAGIVFVQDFVFSVADSGTLYSGHLRNAWFHGPYWLTGVSAGPKASLMALAVYSVALLLVLFLPQSRYNAPVSLIDPPGWRPGPS
jgi:hypothetical protein